ncbi:hypothetical protein AL036_02055 [Salipiger aestuarii]|nr:hypothetical protein AL036_02055 [Salipiger aestuarii]KAA8616311.1 hypothetical protein AL037_01205 [Salipiger aestuarii]KAB2543249.1 hypothetical protein AL035_03170 [Salipiger aestuarii]
MFVIDIAYTAAFDAVQKAMAAHMDFVRGCYATGVFLMSGPKEPRRGGIVIAQAASLAEIEALVARDPFVQAGVVAVQITQFHASNMAGALKAL